MIGAGLLARNAVEKGLHRKPWVKTSLAPGSRVVTDYLKKAGLDKPLDELGFNLVGYGCTTCIGNSGPLPESVSEAVTQGRPGRRGRPLGQPQLRGAHQSAGAGRTTWPVRRWSSPTRSPARPTSTWSTSRLGKGQRRQGRVPEGHLADARRRSPTRSPPRCRPRRSRANTPTRRWGRPSGRRFRPATGELYEWDDDEHLRAGAALLRRHAAKRRRRSGRFPARACWPRWAIR